MVSTPEGTERRSHARTPVDVRAVLTLVGWTVEGRLADVAPGGARFTTSDPHLVVEAGNFVSLTFACRKGGQPIEVQRSVRVAHVAAADEQREVGLEFDAPVELAGLEF